METITTMTNDPSKITKQEIEAIQQELAQQLAALDAAEKAAESADKDYDKHITQALDAERKRLEEANAMLVEEKARAAATREAARRRVEDLRKYAKEALNQYTITSPEFLDDKAPASGFARRDSITWGLQDFHTEADLVRALAEAKLYWLLQPNDKALKRFVEASVGDVKPHIHINAQYMRRDLLIPLPITLSTLVPPLVARLEPTWTISDATLTKLAKSASKN